MFAWHFFTEGYELLKLLLFGTTEGVVESKCFCRFKSSYPPDSSTYSRCKDDRENGQNF